MGRRRKQIVEDDPQVDLEDASEDEKSEDSVDVDFVVNEDSDENDEEEERVHRNVGRNINKKKKDDENVSDKYDDEDDDDDDDDNEYERARLENIRRNQEMLSELGLPGLVETVREEKRANETKRRSTSSSSTHSRRSSTSSSDAPTRRSSRIQKQVDENAKKVPDAIRRRGGIDSSDEYEASSTSESDMSFDLSSEHDATDDDDGLEFRRRQEWRNANIPRQGQKVDLARPRRAKPHQGVGVERLGLKGGFAPLRSRANKRIRRNRHVDPYADDDDNDERRLNLQRRNRQLCVSRDDDSEEDDVGIGKLGGTVADAWSDTRALADGWEKMLETVQQKYKPRNRAIRAVQSDDDNDTNDGIRKTANFYNKKIVKDFTNVVRRVRSVADDDDDDDDDDDHVKTHTQTNKHNNINKFKNKSMKVAKEEHKEDLISEEERDDIKTKQTTKQTTHKHRAIHIPSADLSGPESVEDSDSDNEKQMNNITMSRQNAASTRDPRGAAKWGVANNNTHGIKSEQKPLEVQKSSQLSKLLSNVVSKSQWNPTSVTSHSKRDKGEGGRENSNQSHKENTKEQKTQDSQTKSTQSTNSSPPPSSTSKNMDNVIVIDDETDNTTHHPKNNLPVTHGVAPQDQENKKSNKQERCVARGEKHFKVSNIKKDDASEADEKKRKGREWRGDKEETTEEMREERNESQTPSKKQITNNDTDQTYDSDSDSTPPPPPTPPESYIEKSTLNFISFPLISGKV